jgi:phosphatidylglycerophosphate synthase
MVAGVTVMDRQIVALHRAGCFPITVVSQRPLPVTKRSGSLGIELTVVTEATGLHGPAVVVASNILLTKDDVETVLTHSCRLVSQSGELLPISFTQRITEPLDVIFRQAPPVKTHGIAQVVLSEAQASRAAGDLWASLPTAGDGLADRYFNRPLGRYLARVLVRTPVSPNQVTLLALVIGFLGAGFFAQGLSLYGALLFQLSALFDCVDGDIARAAFKESPLGKWLDIAGDQLVHIAIFGSIALGLREAGSGAPVLLLGFSAAVGVVLSFVVVSIPRHRDRTNAVLQKVIDASTNRDFSVVLLVLCLFDRVDIFLWFAAIGVHIFWAFALVARAVGEPGRTHMPGKKGLEFKR